MYYTEREARKTVLEACRILVEEKLVARTWGNISARISSDEFIITPSGRAYETLRESDLVKVRISDLSYSGDIKPSSEKGIHASCYSLRQDCGFVIHTHQFYASVLCAEGADTPFAPCARYGLSGTSALRAHVAEAIAAHPDRSMFLMHRHGAVLLGKDCEEAFALAKSLEDQSRALFEQKKHAPKKGIWLDDYAQMFSLSGKPNEGEDPEAVELVRLKNETASMYVNLGKPVPVPVALLEHLVYCRKYAREKDRTG